MCVEILYIGWRLFLNTNAIINDCLGENIVLCQSNNKFTEYIITNFHQTTADSSGIMSEECLFAIRWTHTSCFLFYFISFA